MSTPASIYEIRLREEFKNLRKLQRDPEIKKHLEISYADRTLEGKHPITTDPLTINLYPETYFIKYSLPVFTDVNKLDNDWCGTFTLKISERSLLEPDVKDPPYLELDYGNKKLPFNQHISPGDFCYGGVWSLAKDAGIWYFIVGIGRLLNQEDGWMDDSGFGHYNPDAYDYWKIKRKKQSINSINWPTELSDDLVIPDTSANATSGPFTIRPTKKFSFSSSDNVKTSKFTIKKTL